MPQLALYLWGGYYFLTLGMRVVLHRRRTGTVQAGIALLAPSWVALLALALLVLSVEVQVRAVEEPHLLQLHGESYGAYAGRVGRFLPGVGRRAGGLE